MNYFEIFYPLTIFYILCASVQADRDEIHQLKEAKVNPHGKGGTKQIFNRGKVCLYELSGEDAGRNERYGIGNEFQKSTPFPIVPLVTIVTYDSIRVGWFFRTVIMMFNKEDDTFALYKRLLPTALEGKFSKRFLVENVYQKGERLAGVTAVKAKNVVNNNWLLVAVAGDEPRLIFPSSLVKRSPRTISENKVSITLDIEPEIEITVEYDNNEKADEFHKFVGTFGTGE